MPQLSKFKGNPELESKGVWVDYGEGLEFLIAKMSNPQYMAEIRKQVREKRVQFRHGKVSDEETEEMTIKAVAKTVLLGWKNLQGEDGKDIPYSQEKAYEILSDPCYRDLYTFIIEVSAEKETFALEARKEAVGN